MHGGSTRYQVKNRQQGIENEGDSGPNQLRCGVDCGLLNLRFLPLLRVSFAAAFLDFAPESGPGERWGPPPSAWAQALR